MHTKILYLKQFTTLSKMYAFMHAKLPITCLMQLRSKTHFGEKTLQINKWFLINSNWMVYAVIRMEFKHSGTRQGKASMNLRKCPVSSIRCAGHPFMLFKDMYMTMLRSDNIGEAYVIMNIRIPESNVEWWEMPWK